MPATINGPSSTKPKAKNAPGLSRKQKVGCCVGNTGFLKKLLAAQKRRRRRSEMFKSTTSSRSNTGPNHWKTEEERLEMGNRVSQALTNWSQRRNRRVRGGCSLHDEGLQVGAAAVEHLHQADSNEIQWVGRQGGAFCGWWCKM